MAVGHRRLVPGAWGCGVFRNDPARRVAAAFRALLEPGGRFAGAFEHVVFGIPDRTRGGAICGAFDRTFADLAAHTADTADPAEVSSSRTAPATGDAPD